jgi:thioredoxin-related protein
MKQSNGWKMVILVIIIVGAAIAAHLGASALESFTTDDITNNIDKFTGMLVFVMDGCGFCKDLETNVLSKLKKESDNVAVVKRGGEKENALIEKWNVRGFPTIFFLKNGQKMLPPGSGTYGEYEGPRELNTIKRHLKTVMDGYS